MLQNEKIRLEPNQSLILDKSEILWMVSSGEVDLFYAEIDSNGSYMSSLHFLYTAKNGDLIFSLLTSPESITSLKLVIKSRGATLIGINKNNLLEIDHSFLRGMIETWISRISKQIQNSNAPRVHTVLNNFQKLTLKNKTIAYPPRGVAWVSVLEGEISKYSNDDLTTAESQFSFPIPVTSNLWIQAKTAKVQLKCMSTREVLKDEIFFMLALNDLQNYVYSSLIEISEQKKSEEQQRISEKISSEQSSLSRTLDQLRKIVSNDKKTKVLHDSENKQVNNELFKACEVIGDTVGFQFEAPKYLESYSHSTSNQLDAIAQASNVRVRKIILRGTWWKDENGHLLAFYKDEKRPVALIQKSSSIYVLKDGLTGEERVVNHKVADLLEPISYMFFYGFNNRMTSVKRMAKYALQGVKKDGKYLILAALAGSLIGLLIPVLSGIMFDDVIPSADKTLHYEVFVIMLMIGIVTAGLQLVQGVLQLRVETKSSINVQAGVMDHLLRLPVTFYKKFSAGDLTNRALSINGIRQILSNTVMTAVLSGSFSSVNLILLFYYESSLAWIGVVLAIVAVLFMSIIGYRKLQFDRQISNVEGDIQGFLFEFLSGITKIRNTAGERRIFTLWAKKFSKLKLLGFGSGGYQNFVETFTKSYPLLTNIFFFGFIYYTVTNSSGIGTMISVGAFMAFISAFNQFLKDSLRMSMALITSLNIITLYERVKPILEEAPESTVDSTDPGELSGAIEMNSVSFRYFEDQPLILDDVSFKINPGEMVAFVGPSGSGKSTIMRLLLGFEQAEAGSIYYDGEAYDSMNKDLVRRQIGVVLQNGALMSGSIYKNIVGNSELSLEDAWEAARLAGMEEDIKQMPMEMHTVISEGASTFSGGQRQRLMIARAIVHKPRLLFMDEATSALDNRTQSIVSDSLEKLQATRIVIAHRLSTIEKADRIYVLDKGKIVEYGSYSELMANNGVFSKLAKRQIA